MTTDERAAINRANAQKSTGPKTPEGKRRSALNSYRHGATGQLIILPEGDMQAYWAFEKSFFDHFQPVGPLEKQYVQIIVDASWKMNRSSAWVEHILHQKAQLEDYCPNNDEQLNTALAVAGVVARITKDLSNLSLYDQRNLRAIKTARAELDALQKERKAQHSAALERAALLLARHEGESKTPNDQDLPPYNPAADGFVFSIDEIRQHRDREKRWSEAFFKRAA